jgi:L-xylulokinase
MQLKADLTGLAVEVSDLQEPGTFGAALLAGAGAGLYKSAGAVCREMAGTGKRFEPDAGRGRLYRKKIDLFKAIVAALGPVNMQ